MTLPNGKEISIETGKLAKQADGAVVVRMGGHYDCLQLLFQVRTLKMM